MPKDFGPKLLMILAISAFAAYLGWPKQDKWGFREGQVFEGMGIKPGIDIQGGAELTYRVLFDAPKTPTLVGSKSDATDEIVAALKRRVDIKGLKAPDMARFGDDRVIVQLPGVDKDTLEEYKKLFETVGRLELLRVGDKQRHESYSEQNAKWRVQKVNPEHHRIQNTTDNGAPVNYENFPYAKENKVVVRIEPIITGKHIKKATATINTQELGWMITFELTSEGSIRFARDTGVITKEKPKGRIAISLDGEILSMPMVQQQISSSGNITGDFSDLAPEGTPGNPRQRGAEMLAIILEGGELAYPIGSMGKGGSYQTGVPEQESFVGPTLGQDSIRRGMLALGIAGAAVAVFMMVYYRGAGFVAVLTLVLNLCLISGIMSLFGATLTLAGMAGIVLTVGMAVDANILIYERVREELDKGKTAVQAFEQGGERAMKTILDANVTTFIIGLVLYYIAIGPVKGFAITLMVGIVCTLISVLVFGKAILRGLIGGQVIQKFSMMRIFHKPSYGFVQTMPTFGVISAVAVTAALGFFLYRGGLSVEGKNIGVDFKGGSIINFNLREPHKIDEIRSKIRAVTGADAELGRYRDLRVQTVADPEAESYIQIQEESRSFQMRTSYGDIKQIQADLQEALAGLLPREPFKYLALDEVPQVPPFPIARAGPAERRAGAGLSVYLEKSKVQDLEATKAAMTAAVEGLVSQTSLSTPAVAIVTIEETENLIHLAVVVSAYDAKPNDKDVTPRLLGEIRAALKEAGDDVPLSLDPFTYAGNIGPTAAKALKDSSILALLVASVFMVLYVTVRFLRSWKFGLAAVVPLIHDTLIVLGGVALCNALVPDSWGLNFEINMPTVAAILTIVGYSINDTIVLFDRIRENLVVMKHAGFADVINASVNQTLSRTLLTSGTTLLAVTALYALTAHSGGGIAEFSFPMIGGVLIGTYSSIWVASFTLKALHGQGRPKPTK